MTESVMIHPASYRDPSGFIFEKEGKLYRQVNKIFKADFDYFINSGCYESLVKKEYLVPHQTLNENLTGTENWYTTLQPEPVPFISYAYEWSFEMLKDAALLTLNILKEALSFGMILKDATPQNIQWHQGKFIFIDTLSFEKYNDSPWVAYRQFCECFLSPLLLTYYSKKPLGNLLLTYPDGIPLEIAQSLLPGKSKFSLQTYLHVHLHSKLSKKNAGKKQGTVKFSRKKIMNLVLSLESLVQKINLKSGTTAWSHYYDEASQREDYVLQKKEIIRQWAGEIKEIRNAIDLGANNGEFSKLLAAKATGVVAADYDPYCIDDLYKDIRNNRVQNIQPLVMDLANPSPGSGVNNRERKSFLERTKADLVLALAFIHHLAIGKNIPFEMIATMISGMAYKAGSKLIIEFIPKEDEKIKLMLQNRKDIFEHYTEEGFLAAFKKSFTIEKRQALKNTGRILYLMVKN